MKRSTWMTSKNIGEARAILRTCKNEQVKAEGLACLKNAKPEYLMNLIPMDHPNRIAAVQYIERNS